MSHVVTRYGVDIDLSKEGKTACPRCVSEGRDASGDNLVVYGLDGDGKHKGCYCFACNWTYPSQERLEENSVVEDDWEDLVGKEFSKEIFEEIKKNTGINPKGYRGIREDISKQFGVRYEYSEGDGSVVKQMYPITDNEYSLSGLKVRIVPKSFESYGETGKDQALFGQFKFKDTNERWVVITAGEIDMLSAYQMLSDYNKSKGYEPTPVVSSTIGESGSYKQIQKQYQWFSRFQKIILVPDNDSAGKSAVDKIVKVLPKGKVYIASIPLKDCNDMLTQGREKDFIRSVLNAKAYVPDGIVGSGELMNKIKEAAIVPKVPLPPFMHKVQDLMAGGIPLGVILNLGSASGTGKSTIIDECVYYWVFNSPHKVGVVSLESDSAQYGTKILSRHIGRKIDLISNDEYKINFLNSSEVEEKAKELFFNEEGSHRWLLVEERDGGLDSLKELVMSLIIEGDCRVIILDPLQDILDGLSNEEQATFMKWMKGMVKSHGVSFVNVNHVRKSSGGSQANSTGASIHEEDFQGSSSIFKSSACNLLFTRNKEAENPLERNTTHMKMTKCRWTGRTTPDAGAYYYDNETHTLHDLEDYIREHPEAVKVDF